MYATSYLDRYRRLDGKPLEESMFEFIAPGRSLAVDPLSLVKVGSLQDDLQQLTSAAGEVSYPSFYHDLPSSPEWYEEEAFDYDDYLVTQRVLRVSDGEESDDEATRVAVERLQKVCLSAKDVIKTYFGDFKDLCALYRGVAEGALISAESRGWKFERTKGSRCDGVAVLFRMLLVVMAAAAGDDNELRYYSFNGCFRLDERSLRSLAEGYRHGEDSDDESWEEWEESDEESEEEERDGSSNHHPAGILPPPTGPIVTVLSGAALPGGEALLLLNGGATLLLDTKEIRPLMMTEARLRMIEVHRRRGSAEGL
ncbi:hypothetical protein FOZ61_000303 [Perkinsus olseni]|uniref:Uncharacterized protein n=1 Tax=Perkinsus olseni TaxID=32597 RepID=A0A7J6M0C9_PEROL|nr:hypothetical protein FOZ61_000303 [Perkinsus olseni]